MSLYKIDLVLLTDRPKRSQRTRWNIVSVKDIAVMGRLVRYRGTLSGCGHRVTITSHTIGCERGSYSSSKS